MHPHHCTMEGVAIEKKIAKKNAAINMVRLVRLEEEEETRARQQPPAQPAAAAAAAMSVKERSGRSLMPERAMRP